MAKKKSKKLSASSSVALPDVRPLFIDRCAWSRPLGETLNALNAPYIAHHDRFAAAAPDEEWLEVAGREGWIVLTRDKNIRRRPVELEAFKTHRVIVFVLTAGNATANDTAVLIERFYSKIQRLAAQAKPPAMYSITKSGISRPIKFR